MIERDGFDAIMADLAEVFTPLTDRGMDIYFRYLQSESETVLRRAVHWLLENHTVKRFPFLAEISDSCSDIKKAMGLDEPVPTFGKTASDAFCECNGTGFLLKERTWPDGYVSTVAGYCTCDRGQRTKEGHAKFFAWKKRRADAAWDRGHEPPPQDHRAEAAHDYGPDERGRALEENREGLWERRKNDA